MRRQIGDVLLELARWPVGFFRFDAGPIPEQSEIEVDAQDFLVAEGVAFRDSSSCPGTPGPPREAIPATP